MSGFDLLWGFFLLSALQPMLRQRLLDRNRTRLIRDLERKRSASASAAAEATADKPADKAAAK